MLSRSVIFFGAVMGTCVLLFFNTVLRAEPSLTSEKYKSDTLSLNLHEAIRKTFAHNPALRTFSYELGAQSGRQLQAGLAASPEVSFLLEDVLGTGNFNSADRAQATLSIAWVLEGEIRQGYIDVANAGTSSLSTQAKFKRLDVASQTARFYLIVLANQTRLSYAVKTVSLANKTVSAVKKRVAAGKAPEAELARAQAELARQQLDHEDIEHELSSAIHLLAAQWGETQPGFSHVSGDIFNLPTTLSFATLKTQLEGSPEFSRLMSDKRLKQAQLKLAESQSHSPWRLNVGIRHFETTNDQALLAGISIPFGERSRNPGRIIEAQENLSQTRAKENELRVRFETTLYVLSQKLQHSLHRVASYRNNIIPKLEKALKQTRRAYQLGRYSYLEWRSVQADLLAARSALVEASIDAHSRVIEIERLTGTRLTTLAQPTSK